MFLFQTFFFFFFFFFFFCCGVDGVTFKDCPDCDRNVTQMIAAQGYPVEDHWVHTVDGFILSLQRIPHSKNNQVKSNGKAVFLQHGLLDSATTWIILGSEYSLAYLLADRGYDVWLGNSRGNTYSNRAVNMTINDDKFWDFSFDEMGKYDFPAMLEFAMKISQVNSISYIGHSQGTAEAFIGLGLYPDLAEKVDIFIAFGPAAYVGHCTSEVMNLLAELHFGFFFELFGFHQFLPTSHIFEILGIDCSDYAPVFCDDILFMIVGWDKGDFNNSRLPVMISHTPAGTSVKNMVHWAQADRTDLFEMFDYGTIGNKKHYNSPHPPSYHLSNVRTPVATFVGTHDALTTPIDVDRVIKELPNVVYSEKIPQFNHLDYIWDQQAKEKIYPTVFKLLDKYAK